MSFRERNKREFMGAGQFKKAVQDVHLNTMRRQGGRTRDEMIADVRTIIKGKAPTVSVRKGRGSVYGWAQISSKDHGAPFTPKERSGLKELGFDSLSSNWHTLDYDAQIKFLEEHGKKKFGK